MNKLLLLFLVLCLVVCTYAQESDQPITILINNNNGNKGCGKRRRSSGRRTRKESNGERKNSSVKVSKGEESSNESSSASSKTEKASSKSESKSEVKSEAKSETSTKKDEKKATPPPKAVPAKESVSQATTLSDVYKMGDYSQFKFSLSNFITLKNDGFGAMILSTYCPQVSFVAKQFQLSCPQCKDTRDILSFKRYDNGMDVVFVGETKLAYYVIFRGTYTRTPNSIKEFTLPNLKRLLGGVKQWLSNLDADLVEPNVYSKKLPADVRMHQGFQKSYNKLKNEKWLDDYENMVKKNPKKMTIVGGHSRGGAFATIGTLDLLFRNHPVTMLSAGSPKVGNEAFVREFSRLVGEYSFRYVHETDLIPHSQKKGFKHVPREIWEFKTGGKYRICDYKKDQPWIQDPNCSKSVKFQLSLNIPAGAGVLEEEDEEIELLGFFDDLKKKVSEKAKEIKNKVVDTGKKVGNKIKDTVKGGLGFFKKKFDQLKKSLTDHGKYWGLNVMEGEDKGC